MKLQNWQDLINELSTKVYHDLQTPVEPSEDQVLIGRTYHKQEKVDATSNSHPQLMALQLKQKDSIVIII